MMRRLASYIRSNPNLWQKIRNARMFFLRRFLGLKNVHPTFYIQRPCLLSKDLVAGAYGYLGPRAWICPGVKFGNYVMVAPECTILSGDHRFDVPGTPIIFSGRPEPKTTIVEDDVWIGYRVVIMAGVRIGRGAVIASCAVVTKDVEPYAIVAGIPARPIGKRFQEGRDIEMHDRMLSEPPQLGTYCRPQ
jgi:acetyltransferase-like isoleucine patch superfamily enzyme